MDLEDIRLSECVLSENVCFQVGVLVSLQKEKLQKEKLLGSSSPMVCLHLPAGLERHLSTRLAI